MTSNRFLFFLLLILFNGLVFAQDTKQIGDTSLKFLSNTDQCLTHCESWLEWDLSANKTSILTPLFPNDQFNFKTIAKPSNDQVLTNFGVEVWEQHDFNIADYCFIKTSIKFLCANLEECRTDLNGTKKILPKDYLFCQQEFCDIPSQEYSICNYHTESKWEKVSNSFYGFEFKPQKYRLKVFGNKKAELNDFGIDWQPTILGTQITDWAWWNSNWTKKMKITLHTADINISANITGDHVIMVDLNSTFVDFWTNVSATGADIRFVDSTESTEYSFYLQDFNQATDKMTAWVLITDTFTSGADLDFYIYYKNAAASDAQDKSSTLINYLSVYHFDEGKDTNVGSATGNFDGVASDSAIWEGLTKRKGNASLHSDDTYYISQETLLDVMPANLAITLWFAPDIEPMVGINCIYGKQNDNFPITDELMNAYYTGATTKFWWSSWASSHNGVFTSTSTNWDADIWHFYTMTWNTTTGVIVDIDGKDEGTDPGATTLMGNKVDEYDFQIGACALADNPFDGKIDEFKVLKVGLTQNEMHLLYRSELGDLQEYGSEETVVLNYAPDVNITKIDGNLDDFGLPFFSYAIDGNLTIDFNVLDPNFGNFLRVDINYSTSSTTKQGSIIVKDLNLTLAICDDINFVDSTECHWDWDISGIGDNNYFILMAIFDDANLSDYNVSDHDFRVNLKEPIEPYPTQRYLSQNDKRVFDSNRYISQTDSRVDSSTRFFAETDIRSKQIKNLDGYNFAIEAPVFGVPILLYLGIAVILIVGIFLAIKVFK